MLLPMLSRVEMSELQWKIVEDRFRRLKEVGKHAGMDITMYSQKTH